MQLRIVTACGSLLSMEVSSTDTVQSARVFAATYLEVPSNSIKLLHNTTFLKPVRSFADCGIVSETELFVVLNRSQWIDCSEEELFSSSTSQPLTDFAIIAKTLKGQNYSIACTPLDSVKTLACKVGKVLQVKPFTLKLIYQGTLLRDENLLTDRGIRNGSFVVAMVAKKPQSWLITFTSITSGSSHSLSFDQRYTVADVKSEFPLENIAPASTLHFFLRDCYMHDDFTLADYGVQDQDSIEFVQSEGAFLLIKSVRGAAVIDIEESECIRDVRRKFAEKEELRPERIQLFFSGKELVYDALKLTAYHIWNYSTLQATFKDT